MEALGKLGDHWEAPLSGGSIRESGCWRVGHFEVWGLVVWRRVFGLGLLGSLSLTLSNFCLPGRRV